MAKDLLSPLARTSFPNLAKARSGGKGQKEKFSVCLIFDPSSFSARDKERYKELKLAAKEALKEKFGDKAFDKKGKPKANFWPFRDSAEKDHLSGFEDGTEFINARTEIKPGVADARGGKVDGKWPEIDGSEVYPGCYSRVKLQPYAYDVDGNKGIAFGLGNVIVMKNGERLDGARDAGADFEDIDDDELFDDDDDDDVSDDDDDDDEDLI